MGVSSHSAARADHSVKRSLFMNSGTKVRAGPIDKKRTPINISMDKGGYPFLGGFFGGTFWVSFFVCFQCVISKNYDADLQVAGFSVPGCPKH